MKKLPIKLNVMFGCDPEFFFSNSGEIIGAEKVIPKDGLKITKRSSSKITIDGVQAELNPAPELCRALLGEEIGRCLSNLKRHIHSSKEKITVDFSQVVKVSQKEMDSLSDESKKFGCAPSYNFDGKGKKVVSQIKVSPTVYKYRSGGGHIHLGSTGSNKITEILIQPERVIPIMDIIVGNTCVLLDRNEWNKERRKVYGKAGEFRTPPHGIEYRTLSNFWMRSYQLMSFVMGLSRLAVNIVAYSDKDNPYEKAILSLVNRKDIVKAINNNNFNLAYSNFKKIEKTLLDMIPSNGGSEDYYDESDTYSTYYPICKNNIKDFHHFIKKGLDHWFKEDSLEHWVSINDGHGIGWESFLEMDVRDDRLNI